MFAGVEREHLHRAEHVWSILFVTGYLTQQGESDGKLRRLVIPNREIHDIFMTQIRGWMQDKARGDRARLNLDAGCREALAQIEREGYANQPNLDGMSRVLKCGIACYVKNCRAVFEYR